MENIPKTRSVHIDSDLASAVQSLADDSCRSFCGQVRYLLWWALNHKDGPGQKLSQEG